jgi:hypothetical protein
MIFVFSMGGSRMPTTGEFGMIRSATAEAKIDPILVHTTIHANPGDVAGGQVTLMHDGNPGIVGFGRRSR